MILSRSILVAVLALCTTAASASQADVHAVLEFQRAADRYAFQHRQVERRLGGQPNEAAIERGMRVTRPQATEGELFTPVVGSVFRTRLAKAAQSPQCQAPRLDADFRVPGVNDSAGEARELPACMTAVLPRLPPELAYRSAGVALLLVDTHANLVVDVLHAALPAR